MTFGINRSVQYAALQEALEIKEEDFQGKHCYELNHLRTEESTTTIYQFFDFCPRVFHQLRRMYGITAEAYRKSIGLETLYGELMMGNVISLSGERSTGKSGSFFYYTADSRYMLKTISHSEFVRLKMILKQYYMHVANCPHTLITRFCGLHKIRYSKGLGGIQRIYFIVMTNVLSTTRRIDAIYDLKGSTQGRRTRRNPNDKVDPSVALKDLDFDDDGLKISVDPKVREALVKQIELDVALLQQLELFDYSLLLGIHEIAADETEKRKLFQKHNAVSLQKLNHKTAQVLHKNYGSVPVLAADR